ncbi:VWA domain-containing protein [Halobacteriovorax sp. HLS]|uniref:vWA domain-containing protein n=1 Tax=Halobacteriovorax sp. HLS TaxID=2234000 RepID=UPI000FD6CBFA|nr:VWA domain-containing protein [Halobacteriovorax sp. HLS]
MAKRREINIFSISFLDLLSGALGAVIILFVAIPKAKDIEPKKLAPPSQDVKMIAKNQALKGEVEQLKAQVLELEKKIENTVAEKKKELEKIVEKKEAKPSETSTANGVQDVDVGFKFKGKNIVFLIDVSGSMVQGGRIGQVKAGLKMLITSMSKDYKIDVIHFPGKNGNAYYAHWTFLQNLASDQKEEVYKFLENLRPRGKTPTRSALRYALSRYSEATDIVVLSDGSPTIDGGKGYDDIQNILDEVKATNTRGVRISAIGVGALFLSNQNSNRYKFLHGLAKDNNGFFFGF